MSRTASGPQARRVLWPLAPVQEVGKTRALMQAEQARLRVVASDSGLGPAAAGSPGRYLQEQRRARGMSLEQLAAATKIPKGQLALLEADRYEELPAPVFVKGFLRCCARALKVEEEVMLGLLYEREREQLRSRRRDSGASPVGTSPASSPARGGLWSRLIGLRVPSSLRSIALVVAIVLVIIAVIMVALSLTQAQERAPVTSQLHPSDVGAAGAWMEPTRAPLRCETA